MKKTILLPLACVLLLASCKATNVDNLTDTNNNFNEREIYVDCFKEVSQALDSTNKANGQTNSLDIPSTEFEKMTDYSNLEGTKAMISFLSLVYENEKFPIDDVTAHITCNAYDENENVLQYNDMNIKSILDKENNKVLCQYYGTSKMALEDEITGYIVVEVNYDFNTNEVKSFDLYMEVKEFFSLEK